MLAAAYQVFISRWKVFSISNQFLFGILFGGAAVAGMTAPISYQPGIIFDGRSIILSIAGLFGGPLVALISGGIAGAFRIYLGGAGTTVGVSVVIQSTSLGVLFHHLWRRKNKSLPAYYFFGFGVLVHAIMLGIFLFLPGNAGRKFIGEAGLLVIIAYPLVTMLICLLFQDYEEKARESHELRHKEKLLSESQKIARMGSWRYDFSSGEVEWSDGVYEIYKLSPDSFKPTLENCLNIIHPEDRVDILFQLNNYKSINFPVITEFRVIHRAGDIRYISGQTGLEYDRNKNPIAVVGTIQDITEDKNREAELRIAAIAFESQEAMLITDAEQKILRVNKTFSTITGYSIDEIIGQTPRILKSGRHDDAFYKLMWDSLNKEKYWQGEIWNRKKDGEIYPEWLRITVVVDSKDRVINYIASFTDISNDKKSEEIIHTLAFYDSLTNLSNRRLLMERIDQVLLSSSKKNLYGAIMFIDLDNFKKLNDTRGHYIGDSLLIEVAKRLQNLDYTPDTIARLGGDDFVILLSDLDESLEHAARQAEAVAEKIRSVLNDPFNLQGLDYHITASIGISTFIGHDLTVDELMKRTDAAMYQAKKAGRNTIHFFDPETQATMESRVLLENWLREAIPDQLRLYYQMQVDKEGKALGAEVLIRWQHPQKGMISPSEFIPLAEETGLIIPIGKWVLETACSQLKTWEALPVFKDLVLAVNVSAKQFHQPDFVLQVKNILKQTGANPYRLKLELTESILVDDVKGMIAKMNTLKSMGVSFSLDDFGTGYSSLSYLKQMPLDQLKIDQSFVRDSLVDPNDATIVRTIIALGQSLGMAVIAEGVATKEQRDFLAENQCSYYQGYLFSKPVPVHEFEKLLSHF